MMLTEAQKTLLLTGLNKGRVLRKDGQSHLAAWDIRRTLSRVFGVAGWSADVVDMTLTYEDECTIGQQKRPGYEVGYRCTMRLTILDPTDGMNATYTETAFGDAKMGQANRGQIHDFAIKTAESQALKRCAVNLGDQFGLSLYDEGGKPDVDNPSRLAPVVRWSAAWQPTNTTLTYEPNDAGEQVVDAEEFVNPETGELDAAAPAPDEAPEPAPEPDVAQPDPDQISREVLRDKLLEAGKLSDSKKRRSTIARLSLTMAELGCEQEQVPGFELSFGLLRDQAMLGKGVAAR